MSTLFPTVGIFSRREDDRIAATRARLVDELIARDRRVIVAGHEHLRDDPRVVVTPPEKLADECDLMLVVGGDGTLLEAGRSLAPHGTPILGVNLGRLGFMVDVVPSDMGAALDAVFAGRYIRDSRVVLSAQVKRADGTFDAQRFIAINEFVVRNKAVARVLDFDTYTNGVFVSQHRADGIVIATPTGSTAHALSSGGPVLHPGLNALAMVPICPHTLSDRPVIVDDSHAIEVVVAGNHVDDALFTSDGQISETLGPNDRVIMQRAPFDLSLIHAEDYDYFSILRNKLHWGRNQVPGNH